MKNNKGLTFFCYIIICFTTILNNSNYINSFLLSNNFAKAISLKNYSQIISPNNTIATKLCNGGTFLNVLIYPAETCQVAFAKKCEIEIKLTADNSIDKEALIKLLEDKKTEIKSKEIIPACDKKKLELIDEARKKLDAGKMLNEREKILLGMQKNLRNISLDNTLFCVEGRYINKRYCCQFNESNKAEWFLESQAAKLKLKVPNK